MHRALSLTAPNIDSLFIRLLPRRSRGRLLQYGATVLIVLATAVLRFALQEPLHNFPILLFFPAVFICALVFDRGSGFLASALSAAIAAYFFMAPAFSFRIGFQNGLAVAIFVASGFTMAAVTEALREAITQLNESERTKALLLDELAHRTKNDLSIISSAIYLQSRATTDENVREALHAANARVLVVAQAQERLQVHRDGGVVDLAEYVGSLCDGLGNLLRDVRPISIRVSCEPLPVPGSIAVHIGLIVNELVTNSLKYAYPGDRVGEITIQLTKTGAQVTVVVSDDGVGYAPDAAPGMGSKLIGLLARQLDGSVRREALQEGHRTIVTIKDAQA